MLILKNRYPLQSDDTDPTGYPHGKARNASSPNDGTGTPFEKDLVNDLLGFQQALVGAANITPSGNPDQADASDLLNALNSLYQRKANARYSGSGSGLAAAGLITLTEDFADSGFTLESNLVQVPAADDYLVSISVAATGTSTDNPLGLGATVQTKEGDPDAARVTNARGWRYTASPSHVMYASGSQVFRITDPENQRIRVLAFVTDETMALTFLNLSIVRQGT